MDGWINERMDGWMDKWKERTEVNRQIKGHNQPERPNQQRRWVTANDQSTMEHCNVQDHCHCIPPILRPQHSARIVWKRLRPPELVNATFSSSSLLFFLFLFFFSASLSPFPSGFFSFSFSPSFFFFLLLIEERGVGEGRGGDCYAEYWLLRCERHIAIGFRRLFAARLAAIYLFNLFTMKNNQLQKNHQRNQ